MSTYLEICQDVARECDIAQGSSVPTTVTSQTGELGRIVSWVSDEYKKLQLQGHWRWMRHEFTLTTVSGTGSYAFGDATDSDTGNAIDRFKSWYLHDMGVPPTIYLQSAGVGNQTFLSWLSWNSFRYLYLTGTLQNQTSLPVHITIDPQDNIRLGLTPNDTYVVTGEYYRSPQILSANTDEPEMPDQYHELIMYMAMKRYGFFESAQEIITQANEGIRPLKHALRREQGPRLRRTGALA